MIWRRKISRTRTSQGWGHVCWQRVGNTRHTFRHLACKVSLNKSGNDGTRAATYVSNSKAPFAAKNVAGKPIMTTACHKPLRSRRTFGGAQIFRNTHTNTWQNRGLLHKRRPTRRAKKCGTSNTVWTAPGWSINQSIGLRDGSPNLMTMQRPRETPTLASCGIVIFFCPPKTQDPARYTIGMMGKG